MLSFFSSSKIKKYETSELDLPLLNTQATLSSGASSTFQKANGGIIRTGRRNKIVNIIGSWIGGRVYYWLLHIFILFLLFNLFFTSAFPTRQTILSPSFGDLECSTLLFDVGGSKSDIYDLSPHGLAKFGVDALYEKQSTTLRQAKARYELKTGRKTPKGYEKWYEWVTARGLLVDEYDQVYRDFAPFYALKSPHHIRSSIDLMSEISMDEGRRMMYFNSHSDNGGHADSPNPGASAFHVEWLQLVETFAKDLPEYTVVFNYQDEPRIYFNTRSPYLSSPSRIQMRYNLSDTYAFKQGPHPTSDYYAGRGEFEAEGESGRKCELAVSDMGFGNLVNDENAFFLSSMSTGFTYDLHPILSQTKLYPCFSDILIPSIYYYQRYSWGNRAIFDDPDTIPWNKKKSVLWWRGQTSGGRMEGEKWRDFQRFRFIDKAKARPDLIDAKFTLLDYCYDVCDNVTAEYEIGEKKSWQDAYPYKYVFDIDGNTFSGRFFGLLHSNSLVFKSTVWSEFFNGWLRPYEHYIPVLPDLSDLYEKIEWAQTHDLEAQRIAAAGREVVRRVLKDEQMDAYYYAVLLEYAEIQRGWQESNKDSEIIDVHPVEEEDTASYPATNKVPFTEEAEKEEEKEEEKSKGKVADEYPHPAGEFKEEKGEGGEVKDVENGTATPPIEDDDGEIWDHPYSPVDVAESKEEKEI